MKRPNLRIMGTQEREETQVKSTKISFIKMIEKNFPNLKNKMPLKVQEAYGTSNKEEQNRNFP